MKKRLGRLTALLFCLLLATLALSSCQADAEDYVTIRFKGFGTVTVKMDRENAPLTSENFVALVQSGFYDGLTIHRIADLTGAGGYIIQGGDPKGNGTGGSEHTIVGEFSHNGHQNDLSHTRGVISMARNSYSMDSASSQFFFCAGDCTFLDGDYAAFGVVTRGLPVLDKLARVPVDNDNKPLSSVVIRRAVYHEHAASYLLRTCLAAGSTLVLLGGGALLYLLAVRPRMLALLANAGRLDKKRKARLEALPRNGFFFTGACEILGLSLHAQILGLCIALLAAVGTVWLACFVFCAWTVVAVAAALCALGVVWWGFAAEAPSPKSYKRR